MSYQIELSNEEMSMVRSLLMDEQNRLNRLAKECKERGATNQQLDFEMRRDVALGFRKRLTDVKLNKK